MCNGGVWMGHMTAYGYLTDAFGARTASKQAGIACPIRSSYNNTLCICLAEAADAHMLYGLFNFMQNRTHTHLIATYNLTDMRGKTYFWACLGRYGSKMKCVKCKWLMVPRSVALSFSLSPSLSLSISRSLSLSLYIYVHVYIYIYREGDIQIYIYIYIHV